MGSLAGISCSFVGEAFRIRTASHNIFWKAFLGNHSRNLLVTIRNRALQDQFRLFWSSSEFCGTSASSEVPRTPRNSPELFRTPQDIILPKRTSITVRFFEWRFFKCRSNNIVTLCLHLWYGSYSMYFHNIALFGVTRWHNFFICWWSLSHPHSLWQHLLESLSG